MVGSEIGRAHALSVRRRRIRATSDGGGGIERHVPADERPGARYLYARLPHACSRSPQRR